MQVLGADFVISAIGVEPATEWLPAALARAPDGGLLVDGQLRTSDPSVWAAGDCCTVEEGAMGPHWFQMRLWTQVRSGQVGEEWEPGARGGAAGLRPGDRMV